MCIANTPRNGFFQRPFNRKKFEILMPNVKVEELLSKGGKIVIDLFRRNCILEKYLKKVIGYCVWNVTQNWVKKQDSQKQRQGNFFTCEFKCRKPECLCKVNVVITNKFSKNLSMTFVNDVKHDCCKGQ